MQVARPAEDRHDVVGLGNAIVDVIAKASDAQLAELDLVKGAMTLVDAERSEFLYRRMGPGVEMSGGSCANTMAGIAALGGRAGYIGRVADDQLGRVFAHDIRAAGVTFRTAPSSDGPPTARSLIFVTDDAQRTMQTYLGACVELDVGDVDEALVASASIVYLEGYLWDRTGAKAACLKAAEIAHRHGGKVALTLSDGFCVDRWRSEFKDLIADQVDLLFANEAEITSLYQTEDFDEALQAVRMAVDFVALTRGARGSVVLRGDEVHVIDAVAPPLIVDTTGAGDLYAAGFLRGLTSGLDLRRCGRLGALAASSVLGQYGPRPQGSLAALDAEVRRRH